MFVLGELPAQQKNGELLSPLSPLPGKINLGAVRRFWKNPRPAVVE
jgi:hypothetical protein